MREFGFQTPTSLSEAIRLLGDEGLRAKPLAGGTDLLLQMRRGERAPGSLISLRRLPELRGIDYSSERGLRLGAYTTLNEIGRSPEIREHYPCLAATISVMASVQIRNLATVGGNLCNASPSADLAPPLIALDAIAHISNAAGERELPLEALFTAPGESALQMDEILTHLTLPPSAGKAIYIKHTLRSYMDPAVIGVAARLQHVNGGIEAARLVLGAVAPTPIRAKAAERALLGAELLDDAIARVAQLAAQEASPISDIRGSQTYRNRMIEVQIRRALQALRYPGESRYDA